MGLFQAIGQQYRAVWARLSPGHRLILVLLCLSSIGAMVAVVVWSGQPHYEILYAELSAKECAGLVGSLKDAGIQARVADGGSAVMVPASKMHEARMAAAEKGLPASGRAGFDAFRDPKIGMTPFAERVNYLSALQNELATTITSLDPVVYARVHLVVPERALFKKDQRSASASVLVVTSAGRNLTRQQILGITNLVASGVEGLNPENVTVTDGRGNVLAGGGEEPGATADDQFAYRQRVEAYLADKAESMLAKVLGAGYCEVRVSAEMAFEDSRETTRTYDPDKRVVVSERIESTKTTGSSARVGGVVGSAANVPEGPNPSQQAGGGQSSTTENIDTEYMVTESVTETVNRGATLQRLTVAAFLDMSAITGDDASGGPTKEDIAKVIKDAIGFDEKRGDSLMIVESLLNPVTAEVASVGGGVPTWAVTAGQYLAVAVLGLVLLVIARRVLKNIESATPRRVMVPEIMGMQGGGSGQVNQDDMIRSEISRFVTANPEAAGRMLEGWVEGEE